MGKSLEPSQKEWGLTACNSASSQSPCFLSSGSVVPDCLAGGDRGAIRLAAGARGCGTTGWPSGRRMRWGRGCDYVSPAQAAAAAAQSQVPTPPPPHCSLRGGSGSTWTLPSPQPGRARTHLTSARASGSCHAVRRATSRHGEPSTRAAKRGGGRGAGLASRA